MTELPDRVDTALNPGHHLVFAIHEGVLSLIGQLPYVHPDGSLNPPMKVLNWAEQIAAGLRPPRGRLTGPVGVYSGDSGERLG